MWLNLDLLPCTVTGSWIDLDFAPNWFPGTRLHQHQVTHGTILSFTGNLVSTNFILLHKIPFVA